jgi:uncharacterized protein YceH (UPF0502 family)
MTDAEWLSVVEETARDLEGLGWEGSANGAVTALRKAGRPRARAVVLAAQKVRRGEAPHRPPSEYLGSVIYWERRVADLEAQLTEAKQRLEAHRMR